MTAFNTNVTSDLGARTTVGPTKIRSPTRYSDMFVDAEEEVITSMLEGEAMFIIKIKIIKNGHWSYVTLKITCPRAIFIYYFSPLNSVFKLDDCIIFFRQTF